MGGQRSETRDGSTDATVRIIEPYAPKYDWIELVNLPAHRGRNFAAKVEAFNAGQERVKNLDYAVVGNLDVDVSLEKDHFESLLNKFNEDPHLGVAGTVFREESYNSETDSLEGQLHAFTITHFRGRYACCTTESSVFLINTCSLRAGVTRTYGGRPGVAWIHTARTSLRPCRVIKPRDKVCAVDRMVPAPVRALRFEGKVKTSLADFAVAPI
jgi:hypothetical protein